MGVLVAGGTGGLGGAVVRELLQAGYDVTVVDRQGEAPEGAALVHADLLDTAATADVVGGVADLEAVVNLVGGFGMGPKVEEAELEEFERLLAAEPGARVQPGQGGDAGHGGARRRRVRVRVRQGGAGAVPGRGGLHQRQGRRCWPSCARWTPSTATTSVRANAILPSVIDTPANREAMPDSDWSKWVAPEQIARVIRFLVSGDGEVTSGAAVPVYGRA